MIRILNLKSTFAKVEPELDRRITAAARQAQNGSLAVETDIGTVTFNVNRGALSLDFAQQAEALAMNTTIVALNLTMICTH